MNETTRKIRATSNTSNSRFNANIPQWSEASSSEAEDIGMHKCSRKSNVDITNEELKEISSESEEIKYASFAEKVMLIL